MSLVPIKPLFTRTNMTAWLEELRRWCRRNTILDSPDVRVERSNHGSALFVNRGGGGEGGRVNPYLLIDESKPDYFICRTLATRRDPEDLAANPPVLLPAIGADDVFIAKPFHLRQSVFDRETLNERNPAQIGKVAGFDGGTGEITYDIKVEILDDDTGLTTATRKLSYEYFTATFRVATDETDQTDEAGPGGPTTPDGVGDNWFSENQTIIPRFIPAELIETVVETQTVITTKTQGATIIYAIGCPNLENLPGDKKSLELSPRLLAKPMVTEVEDGAEPITLLALNDGWAWAKAL